MKRILLIILAAMPLLSIAQQGDATTPIEKATAPLKGTEISLTGGLAVRTESDYNSNFTGAFCTNLSVLYHSNKLQLGFGFNVDGIPDDYVDIQPHLLLNRTFNTRDIYFYIGGMAGYATRQYNSDFYYAYIENESRGYVLGLQGGAVLKIGKHFGINAEVALRSVQYWTKENIGYYYYDKRYVYEKTTNKFEASMPVKIGVRYKF